jgi:hypothetical protein
VRAGDCCDGLTDCWVVGIGGQQGSWWEVPDRDDAHVVTMAGQA